MLRPVVALPRTPAFGVALKAGVMGLVSVDQWTVTVLLSPDTTVARVRVGGAIDFAAAPALAEAAEQLRVAGRPTILVDLAEVTFASSTLANFLVRVRNAMPAAGELVISRITPQARRLLILAGLESIVVFDRGRSIAA